MLGPKRRDHKQDTSPGRQVSVWGPLLRGRGTNSSVMMTRLLTAHLLSPWPNRDQVAAGWGQARRFPGQERPWAS